MKKVIRYILVLIISIFLISCNYIDNGTETMTVGDIYESGRERLE